MQKKFVLLVLIVLIIVAGGVFVWNKKMNQEVPKNSLKEEVKTAENTDTNNVDTSDWKTYRNEKYGYSMRYPKGWYVDDRFANQDFSQRGPKEDAELMGGDTLFSNYSDAYNFNLGNRPLDIKQLSLVVFRIDPNISYDQFKYGYVEGDEKRSFLEINGEMAYKIERTNTDHPVGVKVVTILLKKGNEMFLLAYTYDPNGTQIQSDTLSTYEKMIESFGLVR
jgi:hypothetical protein